MNRVFAFSRRLTLGLFLLTGAISVVQADVNDQLVQRITQSKNELDALEKKNSQESRSYAQRLEQKEQELKALRTQVASQQRVVDEQLLGLDKLKERVDQWSAQSQYQKQLLIHFSQTAKLSAVAASGDELSVLDQAAKAIDAALAPSWHDSKVVSKGGAIQNAPVLALGPVEIAVDAAAKIAGPLVREKDREAWILDFLPEADQQELFNVHSANAGQLIFDPTLGNALQLRKHSDGLMVYFQKGGVWVIPIIFFGLLALVIALIKAVQLLRLPKIVQEIGGRGTAQADNKSDTPVAIDALLTAMGAAQRKLMQIALQNPVSQQRDDLLVAHLSEHKYHLDKYMGIVATSASVAPLLGLLGTVS
ncbi:MAG TPA: MotA/TolQ/ExbB proton channel family protein, partial [Cellvibrionaceae bacterium]|nr:MotA/TolQ/ExbB proton channel family protein [Cellvibrionaceae bacterium]